jgi:hypothetical protein
VILHNQKPLSHPSGKTFCVSFLSRTEWTTCVQIWQGYERSLYLLHDTKNNCIPWMNSFFWYVPLQSVAFLRLIVAFKFNKDLHVLRIYCMIPRAPGFLGWVHFFRYVPLQPVDSRLFWTCPQA